LSSPNHYSPWHLIVRRLKLFSQRKDQRVPFCAFCFPLRHVSHNPYQLLTMKSWHLSISSAVLCEFIFLRGEGFLFFVLPSLLIILWSQRVFCFGVVRGSHPKYHGFSMGVLVDPPVLFLRPAACPDLALVFPPFRLSFRDLYHSSAFCSPTFPPCPPFRNLSNLSS